MRILITGGYGYVGGRLAQHLYHQGHEVILGSRTSYQIPNWLPKASNVLIDWLDLPSLQDACRDVDVVVHAAGMNANDCQNNPIKALEVNGLFTGKLIAAAKKNKVKRIIYLSTAHVYSSPLVGAKSELNCPRNIHPYATSHLAGENFLVSEHQIEAVILRLSNALGAPVHKDVNCWMLLINDICRQAVVENKIVIRSDSSQSRDFVSLQDVTLAIEHFLNLPLKNNIDNVFNLGGAFTASIYEMAQLVANRCHALFGYYPKIDFLEPSESAYKTEFNFEIKKLLSTGFIPMRAIHQEIDELLLFCRENFANQVV
jgi:UDP-glucose 4-epimerase